MDHLLVQIALPRLYRNRPLYSVALYHELGHFVDQHRGVLNLSMLLHPSNIAPAGANEKSHRTEYFCDILAASYVGDAMAHLLEHIAPRAPATSTHPATSDRTALIAKYLAGQSSPTIDIFQDTLVKLKMPPLQKRFSTPVVDKHFHNIRPYEIKNDQEMHGILSAGWSFLVTALKRDKHPWSELDEDRIVQVVNDLIEKSIRNYAIGEKWKSATPTP